MSTILQSEPHIKPNNNAVQSITPTVGVLSCTSPCHNLTFTGLASFTGHLAVRFPCLALTFNTLQLLWAVNGYSKGWQVQRIVKVL